MKHYDLAILGTGSGNTLLSEDMKAWSIAVVEPWTFGGTCLNRGCIPSKMFIHPADIALEAKRAPEHFNVQTSYTGVDFGGIRDRVFGRIDPIAVSGKDYRESQENITVYTGKAAFAGPKTIEVNGEQFTADRIVIAVGSTPFIPPIEGIQDVHVETSDTIMRMDALPARITVVGGGPIACEMAHVMNAYGSQVTMVEMAPSLLPAGDREMGDALQAQFEARGMDVRVGTSTNKVWEDAAGKHLALSDGTEVVCDTILMVAGRQSNAKAMHCELADIELTPQGKVVVNEFMETNVRGVYALGDVASRDLDLKHVANAHARAVKHNLLHPDSPVKAYLPNQPYVTFSQPEVAAVGITEAQAQADGLDVIIHKHNYGSAAYGWALEDTSSFVKLIVDRKTRLILGAHIIGPQASLLLQILVMGMTLEMPVQDIATKQIWPHPALSEVIEQVLLDVPAS